MNYEINQVSEDIYEVFNGRELITFRFAGFGERLAARIIDSLIIGIPSLIIPLIAPWFYWSFQQSSSRQATVGQRTLGIKLMALDGSEVSFLRATGRFFSDIINSLTFMIGYLMMLFDKNHQCIHDLISSCVVIKELNRTIP